MNFINNNQARVIVDAIARALNKSKPCETPASKPGEGFDQYSSIMDSISALGSDDKVITVGALKVILGQLLSKHPIWNDNVNQSE